MEGLYGHVDLDLHLSYLGRYGMVAGQISKLMVFRGLGTALQIVTKQKRLLIKVMSRDPKGKTD